MKPVWLSMSNLFFKIVPIVMVITAWGLHAQAQETCDCIVGAPGTLESTAGGVQVSGATGLSPAEPGTVLGSGTQVVVGIGTANVNFGSECEIAVVSTNTELTVSQLDSEQLCVRLSSQVVASPAPTIEPASVLLSIGAIGGIVCAVEECWDGDNGGGKKPVSN